MADKEEIIINIKIEDKDLVAATQSVDRLTDELTTLEGQQKRLKESNKDLTKEQKELNKEYETGAINTEQYEKASKDLDTQIVKNNKTIALNQDVIQKSKRERTSNIKLMNTEKGTRDRLRQNVAKLNKEYNSINQTTAEGKKKAEALAVEMKEISDELNEGSKAAGKFHDNIGNYPDAFGGATDGAMQFVGGIGDMIKQSAAFIATPLGAAITAIVAVLGAFKAGLGSSQAAMTGMATASGRVGGAADYMKSKLGKFSEFVSDQLNKSLSNFVGFLEDIGFKDKNTELDEYMNRGAKINQQTERLVLIEAKLNKTRAVTDNLVERIMHKRDLADNSLEKRIKANNQIHALLKKQEKTELGFLDEKIALQRLIIEQEGKNYTNIADLINLQADRITIEGDYAGKVSEVISNINSLTNEQKALATEEKKRQEAKEKEFETMHAEIEATDAQTMAIDEQAEAYENLAVAVEDVGVQLEDVLVPSTKKAGLTFKDFTGVAQQGLSLIADAFSVNADNNLAQLDKQKEASLALVQGNAEAEERINKEFANKANKIKKRQFLIDKAEAIAQIAIQTAVNVVKLAATPPLAIIAGILGAAQIGIVASRKFEPQTFAKGGTIIDGESHSKGGVDVWGSNGQYFGNVEGGESMFVLKKDATEAMALSRMNQDYGGRSFFDTPRKINQDGGQLANQPTLDIQELASALSQLQIVVGVKDIISGVEKRVAVLENSSI